VRQAETLTLTILYLAAVTMISTRPFGSASAASTQARAGRFFGSAQAVHTSFINARLRISVTQMVAVRSFDLLLPALASSRSISSTIFLGLALHVLAQVLRHDAGEVHGAAVLHAE